MKLFSSEVAHDYKTYTFAYAQYAQKEPGDSLTSIYGSGFLPYSGSKDSKNIFYMARSARVVLPYFEMTSENRRIAKKFDGAFRKERVPFDEFRVTEEFLMFCLAYFAQKHGSSAMPRERLEHILKGGLISNTMIYHSDDKPVAYVLEVADNTMGHYWFSFYDLSLARQSLGLWLMQDCVRDAKERGEKYYYLGTVYGEKALYKTNFDPLEWWDGAAWNADIKLLKERERSDSERVASVMDEWKKNKILYG
ncbi:GNAT family N-acetyltransferase [Acetobacteraceae bacterium]|nr:GNAT family N-acetyltransferase [Candidatus Parcubacteria bacterium]